MLVTIFVLGYTSIALEHNIKLSKAASALIAGVLCWTFYIAFMPDKRAINEQLTEHLDELSGILFFLLGAMTIVDLPASLQSTMPLNDGQTIQNENN